MGLDLRIRVPGMIGFPFDGNIVMVGLQPGNFNDRLYAKNIAIYLAWTPCPLCQCSIKRKAYHARNPDPKIQPHVSVIRQRQEKLKRSPESLGILPWLAH